MTDDILILVGAHQLLTLFSNVVRCEENLTFLEPLIEEFMPDLESMIGRFYLEDLDVARDVLEEEITE